MSKYDDIINLPYHRSKTHPHMPVADRAAQFAPFAALTGYGAAIDETSRLTDERAELSEEMLAELDGRLSEIAAQPGKTVTIVRFVADEKKSGGRYVQTKGVIKKIDVYKRMIFLESGEKIAIDDIYGLSD